MNLPAGILDKNTEFFDTSEGLKAFYGGKIIAWQCIPVEVKNLVRKDLDQHPEALSQLAHLPADEQLRVYAKCKFGAMGHDAPDLTECGQSNGEHWDCDCTSCPLKSVLRGKLKVEHGYLSEREIDVTKHLAQGKFGKEAAAAMCISESTLNTHKRNIFTKVGVQTNVELAVWAIKNNLI